MVSLPCCFSGLCNTGVQSSEKKLTPGHLGLRSPRTSFSRSEILAFFAKPHSFRDAPPASTTFACSFASFCTIIAVSTFTSTSQKRGSPCLVHKLIHPSPLSVPILARRLVVCPISLNITIVPGLNSATTSEDRASSLRIVAGDSTSRCPPTQKSVYAAPALFAIRASFRRVFTLIQPVISKPSCRNRTLARRGILPTSTISRCLPLGNSIMMSLVKASLTLTVTRKMVSHLSPTSISEFFQEVRERNGR
mmetsp:Transcript_4220/g.8163  ORF Transcript_4220/g.8163 Transcript_4220/m.8163 type:complete len:250 (+) Transcript_4220:703-1452(+)